MTSFEEAEQERPEFRGLPMRSVVDGHEMVYYEPKEKVLNARKSMAVTAAMLLSVVALVCCIFGFRFIMEHSSDPKAQKIGPIIASVLNIIQISVMNMIYGKVAIKLVDLENWRTDTAYEDSLISKLFVFQMVNNFSSFVYLAFVKSKVDGCVPGRRARRRALWAFVVVSVFGLRCLPHRPHPPPPLSPLRSAGAPAGAWSSSPPIWSSSSPPR